MQPTDTDPDKCRRVGVEEQFIKFRPSPNFKNMKFKFQKSKIEYEDGIAEISPSTSDEPLEQEPETTALVEKKKTAVDNKISDEAKKAPVETKKAPVETKKAPVETKKAPAETNKAAVQPPLPLEEPPPDSPKIKIKQEIEDSEFNMSNGQDLFRSTGKPKPKDAMNVKSDQGAGELVNKSKTKVCRDFMRGECSRVKPCRFAHVFDVSLLRGLYTFCKDYQNKECTFQGCKYVHADPFEEGNFYRTGYMPPHAIAHIRKAMPPPPPPPPPPEEVAAVAPLPADFSNPPPPLQAISVRQDILARPISETSSPRKTEWTKDAALPTTDLITSPAPKKCRECKNLDYRLQHNKEKVNNMLRASQELKENVATVEKKIQRLESVLIAILKPEQLAKASETPGSLGAWSPTGNEKDQQNDFGLNLPALFSMLQRVASRSDGDHV